MEASKPRPLQAMSEEQLKAFMEAVKGDTKLQAELNALADSSDIASLAKKSGYDVTPNDISNVSDEELSEISGGPIVPGLSIAELARQNVGVENPYT